MAADTIIRPCSLPSREDMHAETSPQESATEPKGKWKSKVLSKLEEMLSKEQRRSPSPPPLSPTVHIQDEESNNESLNMQNNAERNRSRSPTPPALKCFSSSASATTSKNPEQMNGPTLANSSRSGLETAASTSSSSSIRVLRARRSREASREIKRFDPSPVVKKASKPGSRSKKKTQQFTSDVYGGPLQAKKNPSSFPIFPSSNLSRRRYAAKGVRPSSSRRGERPVSPSTINPGERPHWGWLKARRGAAAPRPSSSKNADVEPLCWRTRMLPKFPPVDCAGDPFDSSSLDAFLESDGSLDVSFEIPRSFALDGVSHRGIEKIPETKLCQPNKELRNANILTRQDSETLFRPQTSSMCVAIKQEPVEDEVEVKQEVEEDDSSQHSRGSAAGSRSPAPLLTESDILGVLSVLKIPSTEQPKEKKRQFGSIASSSKKAETVGSNPGPSLTKYFPPVKRKRSVDHKKSVAKQKEGRVMPLAPPGTIDVITID
ncbi:unnamed protein product [Cyprideis torosa]|uniref:Uncharacterized protein n=1 Tax=Cyprideis torosa TaxID=163714 RepID=A0A7R8ZNR9_9CRUS|nr:unnamed protein product [Cyprideis torosa]CAG0886942.1 unnamed protein product [Cyprideis torosa]